MPPRRNICLILTALVFSGCAPLPYLLHSTHDTLIGIDVSLESGAGAPAHMTMVREFVRSSEIHEISATLGTIMASTNMTDPKLQDLQRLQERMADALDLFAVNPVDAKEYIVTPDHSRMDERTIHAVYHFVPDVKAIVGNDVGLSVYQIGRTGAADRALWTWNGETGAR